MSLAVNATKGDRVRAQWLESDGVQIGDVRIKCLAGMGLKFGAAGRDVTGVIRHIYGTTPSDPDPLVYLDPETPWEGPVAADCSCGGPHVVVRARHIVAVLPTLDLPERWWELRVTEPVLLPAPTDEGRWKEVCGRDPAMVDCAGVVVGPSASGFEEAVLQRAAAAGKALLSLKGVPARLAKGRALRHAVRPPTRGYWVKRCRCATCSRRIVIRDAARGMVSVGGVLYELRFLFRTHSPLGPRALHR